MNRYRTKLKIESNIFDEKSKVKRYDKKCIIKSVKK